MSPRHKNKTVATFLATFLGGLGVHRVYLHGWQDKWAWLHFISLPVSALIAMMAPDQPLMFTGSPFVLSVLAGCIASLTIGVTPDSAWDARFNPGSGRQSMSDWPLAVLLVLTVGVGATALIAAMARISDLLLTGGAFG
ncbi:NINE protein [Herminiimonas sp. CN]|uniref:NINE protein n=1 Tax=Herminiimonas sp. CN TaxID=1349818 RepID=UPI000473BD99|nr:TM2 domain-containing protein [Herminiimonas sp. CN]